MNLRLLEYFVNVVQQGSIKAAAEQLGVSQPTVSSAVKNLELEFATRLLERRREGSVPTQFGKSLYDSAITVAGVMENARQQIDTLKDPGKGHLRIGIGPSVADEFAARVLARLLSQYPGARLDHSVRTALASSSKCWSWERLILRFAMFRKISCHRPLTANG